MLIPSLCSTCTSPFSYNGVLKSHSGIQIEQKLSVCPSCKMYFLEIIILYLFIYFFSSSFSGILSIIQIIPGYPFLAITAISRVILTLFLAIPAPSLSIQISQLSPWLSLVYLALPGLSLALPQLANNTQHNPGPVQSSLEKKDMIPGGWNIYREATNTNIILAHRDAIEDKDRIPGGWKRQRKASNN